MISLIRRQSRNKGYLNVPRSQKGIVCGSLNGAFRATRSTVRASPSGAELRQKACLCVKLESFVGDRYAYID